MQPPSHSHSASGECGHAMRHWRSWQSRGGGASRAAGAAGTAAGRLEQPEVMAHTWVQHKGHGRIEVAAQLGNETHSAARLGSTEEQCAQPCRAVHLVPGTAAAPRTRQAQCQAGATAQQHPLNCTAPNVAPVVLQHICSTYAAHMQHICSLLCCSTCSSTCTAQHSPGLVRTGCVQPAHP